MGKLLVKLGLKVQDLWKKFQCLWNKGVSKIMFSPSDCPHKLCTCNK